MFIEQVTAVSFGPFVNSKLELAPGMNVIVGRNESGKSTWHAALYAALTGRRRARGRPSPEDADFRAHHRPWDRDTWVVSAVVRLDGGRRIEIRQDLDGKVDCRATDLSIGKDVSAEIMYDGSPDATRWLGLNRRTFASTACVSQAALLSVLEQADGLQEHLQRAAATAGTDATAAAALNAIETYVRDRIGSDRANSTKPLRKAMDDLTDAERKHTAAVRAHAEYLALVEEADGALARARRLEAEAHASAQRFEALSVALESRRSADRAADAGAGVLEERTRLESSVASLRERFQRAAELTAALPERDQNERSLDEQVARVAEVLADWRNSPLPRALEGPRSDELRETLTSLPEAPVGDTEVHANVASARLASHGAREVRANIEAARPQQPGPGERFEAVLAAGVGRSRSLAAALESLPSVDENETAWVEVAAEARAAVRDAEHHLDEARTAAGDALQAHRAAVGARDSVSARASRESRPARGAARFAILIGLAGVLVVAAVIALVTGSPVLSGVALAAAIAAGGAAAALRPRAASLPHDEERAAAQEAVDQAARQLQDADETSRRASELLGEAQRESMLREADLNERERLTSRRDILLDEISRAGLVPDATAIRALADEAELWRSLESEWNRWNQGFQHAQEAENAATEALIAELVRRNELHTADPEVAVSAYEARCQARAQQAAEAARRPQLEEAYERRLADERELADAEHKRVAAEARLRVIAEELGVDDTQLKTAGSLVQELVAWFEAAQSAAEADRRHHQQRGELSTLLSGRTLDALQLDLVTAEADLVAATEACRAAIEAAEEANRRAEDDLGTRLAAEEIELALKDADIEAKATAQAHVEALGEAKASDGARSERARALFPVADAVESVEACQMELARVRSSAEVLEKTASFLRSAQERVHRDIAPELARTLGEWLPAVTEGRYTDAIVDPATLQVQVAGADRQFRRADLLSFGTSEQVYLLLRASLTKHLTAGHDTCPLILDDPTVQADSVRIPAALDLLHELSSDRQIVVFAQQDDVAEWAELRLTEPRDRLIKLEQVVLA